MRRGRVEERPVPGSWHVAVVVENVPLGIDTRLVKQVAELLTAGYRVSVVTMRDETNAGWGRRGVRLLEYPAGPEPTGPLGYVREFATAFGWTALHLVRLRMRGRVHVVQFCQPPDIYFPLAWLMRAGGSRVVVDQRDLMPELLRARYARSMGKVERVLALFERQTQRAAHATLTVNHFLERRMQEAGAPPERVFVVWNGPVLARVRPQPDPELVRDGRRLVVWAGKMGRQDRVDLVLDVAEQVVRDRRRNDCRFVLLGDGECLEELRAAVVTRHLEDVVSLPGWVAEEEVFRTLASATLGLDTSLQEEVSPVKAMEYMAHGLAFVCFDLPESRALADGAAVLAPPGDVGAVTNAVLSLLDDDHRRRRLGEAGRLRVENELAWEQQAEVYLRVMSPGWSASGR
jgi:glycosyltransferase involved in cell wall biosynthesis